MKLYVLMCAVAFSPELTHSYLHGQHRINSRSAAFGQYENRLTTTTTTTTTIPCMSSVTDPDAEGTQITQYSDQASSELSSLLDNMDPPEKYALLLQSYSNKLIANVGGRDKDRSLIEAVENLYAEMVTKSIPPTRESTQSILNAGSAFGSGLQLSRMIQLAKATGDLKAFGASVGQLTAPIISADKTALFEDLAVPADERELETAYAGGVFSWGLFWVTLQISSTFNSEAAPWALLVGLLGVLAGSLDVVLRQGEGLKLAAAGFDRIAVRDEEREATCDSASFLIGYLLGLPCFCFQCDVGESLKMLRENPDVLDVYKQPNALNLIAQAQSGAKKPTSDAGKLFGDGFKGILSFGGQKAKRTEDAKAGGDTAGAEAAKELAEDKSAPADDYYSEAGSAAIQLLSKLDDMRYAEASRKLAKLAKGSERAQQSAAATDEEDLLALGRVLIWLMAPVAAETLRYQNTVASDPKRGGKLLAVLGIVRADFEKETAAGRGGERDIASGATEETAANMIQAAEKRKAIGCARFVPPASATADKESLLRWAYYEARLLVRQYGEVLETLRDYLATDASSVAECAYIIEDEIIS